MLNKYDDLINKTLKSILNLDLVEDSWVQCSLPVSIGGLGIRKASDLAPPAFLGSAHGAMDKCKPFYLRE